MAMMRNLRNIIKSGASNMDKVYEYLTDEERVLVSYIVCRNHSIDILF